MIDGTDFLANDRGALNQHRLLIVGGMLLIAGVLGYEMFGTGITERLTAEDPGVEAFSAELGIAHSDIVSR